jgi:hypothetical protein
VLTGYGYDEAVAIFYKENAAAGAHSATVVIDNGNDMYAYGRISEFSGIATSGALEASAETVTTAAGSSTSVSASNTTPDALVIVVCCAGFSPAGTLTTATSGFSTLHTDSSNAVDAGDAAYKVVSSAALQTANWSWGGSTQTGAVMAIFKAAGGGGGGSSDPAASSSRFNTSRHTFGTRR